MGWGGDTEPRANTSAFTFGARGSEAWPAPSQPPVLTDTASPSERSAFSPAAPGPGRRREEPGARGPSWECGDASGTVAGTAQGGHADSRSGSRRPKPPDPGAARAEPGKPRVPDRPRSRPSPRPSGEAAGPPPGAGSGERSALTGAQEALRQPSEAARVVRRSIFHVGAEAQRGRGGEGEACASGPPRGLAATSRAGAGAGAGAVRAGARGARRVRAAGGGAEREPGRRRQAGPGAGREQQTQERRGEGGPPPAAAAAATGTAAGGDAQGSCLRAAAASIAAAASSRRCALPSREPRGEGAGR